MRCRFRRESAKTTRPATRTAPISRPACLQLARSLHRDRLRGMPVRRIALGVSESLAGHRRLAPHTGVHDPSRSIVGAMKSWDLGALHLKPRLPEIISSSDDARAVVLDLASGES